MPADCTRIRKRVVEVLAQGLGCYLPYASRWSGVSGAPAFNEPDVSSDKLGDDPTRGLPQLAKQFPLAHDHDPY